jgi:hypothetical protein
MKPHEFIKEERKTINSTKEPKEIIDYCTLSSIDDLKILFYDVKHKRLRC